jgi:uncharacterized protein YbcI
MATPSREPPFRTQRPSGRLNAAVSSAVVGLCSKHIGRGPTKARTTIDGNLVVVLLRDGMTTAEKSLVRAGKEAEVQRLRRAFQETMRAELIDTVERLTDGNVTAFMSVSHSDPDIAAEIFVMDRSVEDGGVEPVT